MGARTLGLAAVLAALALPATGQAAERAKAQVDCAPAGEPYVYDCTIMLTGRKSGEPIVGAAVVVRADMPTMPMAHNVKPVTAMAMAKPGMYHARITLAMHGEWTLTLDLSGAIRDKIIHAMRFDPGEGEHAGMKHEMGDMKREKGAMAMAGAKSCRNPAEVTDEAERQVGGALYAGPVTVQAAAAAKPMPEMAGAHMVHVAQRGGAFFMAPDKIHHVEALFSGDCGLRVFFFNAFTKPIGATRFRAFARVMPESEDEPESLRFLTPSEDGTMLAADLGDEVSRPFEVELYIEFPESDEPQLFNVRVPVLGQ